MFSFLSFIQEGCIKLIKTNSQQWLRPENIYIMGYTKYIYVFNISDIKIFFSSKSY